MNAAADTDAAIGWPSPLRAWLTVGVLMTAYVLAFIDRQILNLMVGPVRADLGISDIQISLLMGLSFALFYTVCGIPLGWLADRGSRRTIIAAGIAFWSLMTAGCGVARSYVGFLLCRIGVGVGEATLSPSAYSLIADSFPPARRATAISVYSMGIYLGSGLAFLLGGLVIGLVDSRPSLALPVIGSVRPWQTVFLVLGGCGLLFSAVLLAVREPRRKGVGADERLPAAVAFAWFRANRRTVLHHHVGVALVSFAAYGSAAWVPTFFIRSHGWDAPTTGIVYGALTAVFGCAGIVAGGRLADRWLAARQVDASLRVCALGAALGIPFSIAFPLLADPTSAVAALAPAVFALAMPFGVAPAAIQEIMPNALRSRASAVYLLVVNLIGLGLGPTVIALGTERLFGDPAALRHSLALCCPLALAGAWLLLQSGRPAYRASVARLREWSPPAASSAAGAGA